MKMLINPKDGWKKLQDEELVVNPQGLMTFFPLCCSTGVLKNVQATRVTSQNAVAVTTPNAPTTDIRAKVKKARYIHEIVREAGKMGVSVLWPFSITEWNCMSLIYCKTVEGTDDGPSGGYNNYKASQCTFFDRTHEDKLNKKFRFSYNTTYGVDEFITFLDASDGAYGEVLTSTAKPGGHGARVRGCIFTPDHAKLKAYHSERIEQVRNHVLGWYEFASTSKSITKKAIDAVAGTW